MHIIATMTAGKVHAKLHDSLDISAIAEARDHLLQLLNSGSGIRFDFCATTEIDTAGVQLVLAVRKEAIAMGKDCRFVHPSPVVEEAFRTLGRLWIFDESVVTPQAKG